VEYFIERMIPFLFFKMEETAPKIPENKLEESKCGVKGDEAE